MSRGAIINADDFGLSPGVNRGILGAFRDGVLTSTTMLVNMPFLDDAVRIARENPDLPVGIHLSLLWGPPVSPSAEVTTLLGSDDCFPRSLTTLARRYFLGRLSLDQVRREFSSQIRRFVDTGLRPTHVDTHKHVHCLPGVLEALLAATREFGIDRVRLPIESPPGESARPDDPTAPRPSWKGVGKRRLIGFFSRDARQRLRRAQMKTTDHFSGIERMDCLNSDVLRHILLTLRDGVTEIMCHPGYSDDEARAYSSVPPHREAELAGLVDPRVRECVNEGNIRLMHYGDL